MGIINDTQSRNKDGIDIYSYLLLPNSERRANQKQRLHSPTYSK